MPMAPQSKLLFTILIQHHSPEDFKKTEMATEDREFKDYGAGVKDAELEGQARSRYRSSRPILHRFNDLVGFAEVYWDRGTRIMVDCYFRGDRRTRYGERIQSRSTGGVSREWFYAYAPMTEMARIHPGDDVEARRQAILRALDYVEETAQEVLCFADTSPECAIVQALDVDSFFT
jgi:hypothetical protein